jgi:hypothetical protein
MPRANYPTTSELTGYLGSPTLPTVISSGYQSMLDSAVEDFERLTGIKPFKADANASTTIFSSAHESGDALYLPTTYFTLTSLKAGVTLSDAGTELVVDQDYFLLPEAGPYDMVRFRGPRSFGIKDFSVTGRKGYSTTIPEDVFEAILLKAAVTIYNYQANAAGGSAYNVKQGPVELNFGESFGKLEGGLAGKAKAAEQRFNAVVAKYKRMVIL